MACKNSGKVTYRIVQGHDGYPGLSIEAAVLSPENKIDRNICTRDAKIIMDCIGNLGGDVGTVVEVTVRVVSRQVTKDEPVDA